MAKATVARIGKRAGVSTADFYRHFETKEDCFAAAYDEAVEAIRRPVLSACAAQEDWPAAVRGALAALLTHLAGDPAGARLVFVEGLFAGPRLYEHHQRALDSFVPYLREGGGNLPPQAAEALLGGIVALITKPILAGETETIEGLLPELIRFTLAPYEGVG